MTKRERIHSLANYRNEAHPIVSLYLNVTRPWEISSKINSMVRGKIKELRDDNSLDQGEKSSLEKLLLRIEEYILNREGGFKNTKLLVLFADSQGYWEEFELPVAHPSMLTVGSSPKVRPLIALQEQFPLFCVVVADSHRARMFSYGGGKITEHSNVFSVEEIEGSRDEAHQGFGEQRYQRYIQDHVLRHIKRTADTIFETFQNKKYDYLIVGASEGGLLNTLEENLHSYLSKCFIGEIQVNPENDVSVIQEKVKEAADEWEKKHEKETVNRLFENAYKNGKAVLGTGPTIKALMNGQVHTLVVHPEAKKEGYYCPNDHYLSLSSQKCPVCGTELEKTENIIDEMVAEAIEQRGEISHLFNFSDKIEEKETGALLRFVVQ